MTGSGMCAFHLVIPGSHRLRLKDARLYAISVKMVESLYCSLLLKEHLEHADSLEQVCHIYRLMRISNFQQGTVYEYGSPEYNQYMPGDTRQPGSRSVIKIDIHKVMLVCLRPLHFVP
jgi:hypothetical protein